MDILDERKSMDFDNSDNEDSAEDTIDKETLRRQHDNTTFAREGTVHNPVYLDDDGDGTDPHTDFHNPPKHTDPDDLDLGHNMDSDRVSKEDDFCNIFDDDYFRDGPVTLLSYARKQEEDRKDIPNDNEDDTGDFSDIDDPLGPQYEPIKDLSALSGDDTKDIDPTYATISRNSSSNLDLNVMAQPPPSDSTSDGDDDMLGAAKDPKAEENETPDNPSAPKKADKSHPNLLRTGSVAKLVDAFTKGKVNDEVDKDENDDICGKPKFPDNDDVKMRQPHAYGNPLYQEEKKLMSHANPMYKDDEDFDNTSSPPLTSNELMDEQQYLAPVDSLASSFNNAPVPSPRATNASQATTASNLNRSVDGKESKKQSKPPPPPPVSTKPKKNNLTPKDSSDGSLTNQVNGRKQPPPVAPKRVSLKNKTPLDRALSLQPNQKAPAPPPRVRSVRL